MCLRKMIKGILGGEKIYELPSRYNTSCLSAFKITVSVMIRYYQDKAKELGQVITKMESGEGEGRQGKHIYISLDTFVSSRNKLVQLSRKGIYFVVHQMNKNPGEQDPDLHILVMFNLV